MKILVTGAAGSIGVPLEPELRRLGHTVTATDLGVLDVRKPVSHWPGRILRASPDVIVHLAGAKHAPEGELDPAETARTNVVGTENVLAYAAAVGARVVTASTCKAADPETVYGATKLVAERMTLNAGGVVVRYYNIPESGGNVFRLWESLPADEPLPVCDAWRYLLPMRRAVALTIAALDLPAGRYSADPGPPQHMPVVAEGLYPGRPQTLIPLRRGDRHREPLTAACESSWRIYRHTADGLGLFEIKSPYDPAPAAQEIAA